MIAPLSPTTKKIDSYGKQIEQASEGRRSPRSPSAHRPPVVTTTPRPAVLLPMSRIARCALCQARRRAPDPGQGHVGCVGVGAGVRGSNRYSRADVVDCGRPVSDRLGSYSRASRPEVTVASLLGSGSISGNAISYLVEAARRKLRDRRGSRGRSRSSATAPTRPR